MTSHLLATRPTLAIEEDDRWWLRDLDLDLLWECFLDDGSECAASIVGRLVMGSKLPPGLADREMRGHPIMPFARTALSLFPLQDRAASDAVVNCMIPEACDVSSSRRRKRDANSWPKIIRVKADSCCAVFVITRSFACENLEKVNWEVIENIPERVWKNLKLLILGIYSAIRGRRGSRFRDAREVHQGISFLSFRG